MNKIQFEIENSSGEIEKMELLLKFRLDEFNKNYIFYRNFNEVNPHYYAASYENGNNNEFSNLNTDFTDKEKAILNEIFNKFRMGEFKNA